MKKYIYITIAIIAFTIAAADTSYACSCMASRDSVKTQITKAYKNSAAIFSGKVISAKQTEDGSYFIFTFAVNGSWKGKLGKEVTVITAKDSSMCGYRFEDDKEYLVYAHGSVDELRVGICSRTASMSDSSDVKQLAKLKKKYDSKN
jgi:hypothetical protein